MLMQLDKWYLDYQTDLEFGYCYIYRLSIGQLRLISSEVHHHGTDFTRSAWKVGFVSWGMLTGYLVGLPLLAWKVNVSPYLFFDVVFPSVMITHPFGRIGCLFYGCCYGKETTSGARIRYEHPGPEGC